MLDLQKAVPGLLGMLVCSYIAYLWIFGDVAAIQLKAHSLYNDCADFSASPTPKKREELLSSIQEILPDAARADALYTAIETTASKHNRFSIDTRQGLKDCQELIDSHTVRRH